MCLRHSGKQAIDCSVSPASRPDSDRTWNAFQGITFASSHEITPSQRAPYLIHSRRSPGKSLQTDPSLWTDPETQEYIGSRDEIYEGSGNNVSTTRPMHLLETQHERAISSPGSEDEGHISAPTHPEGCPPPDDGIFRTPLGFHIPAEKMRTAMLAEPLSSAAYWHYSLYQGPGGDKDKVKVHYCKNKEATEKAAQLFLDEGVLGFDIEWKSNSNSRDGITKNVALIQLASEERVLLAHIAQYPNAAISEKQQQVEDFVAPSLKKIMYGSSRCCFVPIHSPSRVARCNTNPKSCLGT